MRTVSSPRGFTSKLAAGWVLLAGSAGPVLATDFIRGDSNGDRAVSFADGHFVLSAMFRGDLWYACEDAADFDDSGDVDVSDGFRLLMFALLNGEAPPAPYPAQGPDPTTEGDGLSCASYEEVPPLEDPASRVAVLDAMAAGGDDTSVDITIAVSSSAAIAGYAANLRLPPGLLLKLSSQNAHDLTGTLGGDRFLAVLHRDDVVRIGYLPSLSYAESPSIPAGEDVAVLRLSACLAPGTPAGEYPLSLESAELADWISARSVHPALESGTLTVLSEAGDSAECSEGPEPPPESINVSFRLEGASAPPGGTATMPFIIHADAGVEGYAVSVDFDEEVLQAAPVEEHYVPNTSTLRYFYQYVDNENASPGNAGVDEGFIIAVQVFSMEEPIVLPPDTDNETLRFQFNVNPETTVSATEVRFLDGGQGVGQPVRNVVTALGRNYTPELADSFVFTDGVLNVLPDITLFIRGDANGDEAVNLSDAEATLGWLFLGSAQPACFDAADTNDNGAIDIADPIHLLQYLFLGTAEMPSPHPERGEDPTQDSFGCRYRS